MEEKEKFMVSLTIELYDIINIVNKDWGESFTRVDTNKKIIAEQKWFSYNHNLTSYHCLSLTMTKEEKANELLVGNTVVLPCHKQNNITDLVTASTLDPQL